MVTKIRSLLIPFVTLCSILGVSMAVIAYGRGYRLDIKKNSLRTTGLISATSDPVGAQVFVEGELKTATNNSFAIDPGWYTVSISKEGFIPWQKKLRLQGEIVARADAFLFPTNPSLSPLTTLGIHNPLLSPDGSSIAYVIPQGHLENGLTKKAGLWVYTLSEGPLGRNRDPIQLAEIQDTFDVSTATLNWSPDSTEILAVVKGYGARLYEVSSPGTVTQVTATYQKLLADWEEERITKDRQKLAAFAQPIIDIATSSAKIISLSPDETKLLYEATAAATIPIIINPPLIGTNATEEMRTLTPGAIYVYDSKEDKNFFILDKKELPTAKVTPSPTRKPTAAPAKSVPIPDITTQQSPFIHWFPTSRHILLTLPGKIDIMEYDRTNWVTVYAGPLAGEFVAPWSNGSRIVILTNLNPGISSLPNLYSVNLR